VAVIVHFGSVYNSNISTFYGLLFGRKMFLFEKWLSTKNGAGCNSTGVAWGN
jgi:hypothetical protein